MHIKSNGKAKASSSVERATNQIHTKFVRVTKTPIPRLIDRQTEILSIRYTVKLCNNGSKGKGRYCQCLLLPISLHKRCIFKGLRPNPLYYDF